MQNTNNQKFELNWQKYAPVFGRDSWDQEGDFCYYIEAPLPLDVATKLHQAGEDFRAKHEIKSQLVLPPEQLHLTIALPGRLGTHFQKNDLRFMKKTLEHATKQTPGFSLSVNHLNVFPSTLFAQIEDPSGRLQQLHETLCNEIPFSQHPEFRFQNYLPHVSLAYGCQASQLPTNAERTIEPIEFTLERLHLGKAQWQGVDLHKELAAEFNLQ